MAEETLQEETVNIDLNNTDEEITGLSHGEVFDDDLAFMKTSQFINTKLKKHVTAAPTYSPKTFNEQIVLLDDGANFILYVWINSTWRYIALT